jgi:hypothetical protein
LGSLLVVGGLVHILKLLLHPCPLLVAVFWTLIQAPGRCEVVFKIWVFGPVGTLLGLFTRHGCRSMGRVDSEYSENRDKVDKCNGSSCQRPWIASELLSNMMRNSHLICYAYLQTSVSLVVISPLPSSGVPMPQEARLQRSGNVRVSASVLTKLRIAHADTCPTVRMYGLVLNPRRC